MPVDKCLRPARGGRVLRADAAAHWDCGATGRVGVVEDRADVASVAVAALLHQARRERFLGRDTDREEQRAGAVIARRRVAGMRQVQAEQHLRHIVTARGELVEHPPRGKQRPLLEIVQCAAGQHEAEHAGPVGFGPRIGEGGRHAVALIDRPAGRRKPRRAPPCARFRTAALIWDAARALRTADRSAHPQPDRRRGGRRSRGAVVTIMLSRRRPISAASASGSARATIPRPTAR